MIPNVQIVGAADTHPEKPVFDARQLASGQIDLMQLPVKESHVEVFDLMGRPVWSTTQTGRSDMFTSFPITWDLCNSGGARVQRGIYIYRATISTDGKQHASKAKKIAVAGQ